VKTFYDITRTLGKDEICYPGDSPFEVLPKFSLENSDPFNLMQLKLSNHLGTHIDAPKHFFADGKSLDSFSVDHFFMEALVIENNSDTEISEKDLTGYSFPKNGAVLFKTKNLDLLRNKFEINYIFLSEGAAKILIKSQIALLGIDYISIDSFHDDSCPVHRQLLSSEILILEDINLKDVRPGKYQLICLPLKISNSDGAPCRAVLVK
jgi:arylformamidase